MSDKPDSLRKARVVIYMTEEDAARLFELAENLGFRSRSTLIVAILERLIAGGFSVATWFRVGWQFMKRLEERGHQFTLDFGIPRPLPALPVEDDPTFEESESALREIIREIA